MAHSIARRVRTAWRASVAGLRPGKATAMTNSDPHPLLTTRAGALHDRDPAAFLATYAPCALVFDLAPPLAHGLDPDGVAAWMASWDGPIGSETRDLRVDAAGTLALVYCLERLHGRQGGEDRDVWMRLTLCLRLGPDGWRITHEHVSVPVRKQDGTDDRRNRPYALTGRLMRPAGHRIALTARKKVASRIPARFSRFPSRFFHAFPYGGKSPATREPNPRNRLTPPAPQRARLPHRRKPRAALRRPAPARSRRRRRPAARSP